MAMNRGMTRLPRYARRIAPRFSYSLAGWSLAGTPLAGVPLPRWDPSSKYDSFITNIPER